ncbi:dystrobrevin, putative [Ixodes scapularis]|uniref:Dystrobrevin, putative n=1 Tax=Ixodes scapularis TaxID=6945 RepID=B7PSK0_IXOSC|nr:dystrobrevin, putative [Ixodes scapularis]|eukprot:XP_002402689.1 dystrobrevin, putative [Ixodes scapularis]
MSALTLDAREESMELSPYLDDVLPHGMAADLKLLMAEMMHLVDLWNMIEAFRENAFHSLEPLAEVSLARTQTLVTSVYYQLNKRLPPTQQVDLGQCVSLLLHWLLATYDPEQTGLLRVLSLKVSLSIMCAGKMVDKLRYLFSLLADSGGHLMPGRFAHFLEEALALPASVLESPTFHYTESLPAAIFDHSRFMQE